MKKKVLVAGASSFIGMNFILQAPKEWKIIATYRNPNFLEFIEEKKLSNVIPIKCDFLNNADIKKLFQKFNNFDIGLYLIANTSTPLSVKEPLKDLEQNTIALLNFLEYFKGGKLLFFSSGAVYDGIKGKVKKDQYLNPTLPYAISKLTSEFYVRFYCLTRKTFNQYVNIRFFGAYGPYELERKIYTMLIKRFYFEKKNDYEVYGGGKNIIDAMYIDDSIKAILKIMGSKKANITLDLCVGKPVTINQLVRKVADIFKIKNIGINHKGITAEPVMFIGSNKEMKKYFNFEPEINLKEGMLRFAKFLEKQGFKR